MSQSSESDSSSDEPMVITEIPEKQPDYEDFQQFQSEFMQKIRTSIQELTMQCQSVDVEKGVTGNKEIGLEEQEMKQSNFEIKDQIKLANVKSNFYQEMSIKMEDQLEFFQKYYNNLIDDFNEMEIKRSVLQNQISANNAKFDEVANLYIGLYADLEDDIEEKNNQLKELEVERNYYAQCQQETQLSILSMENELKCQEEEMKNVDQEYQKMTELQQDLEALKCTESEIMKELRSQEDLISADADYIRDSRNKLSQFEIECNKLAEDTKHDEDHCMEVKEKIASLNVEITKITDEKFNEMLKRQDQQNRAMAKSLSENLKISEQEDLNLKEETAHLNAVMLKLDHVTKEYAALSAEMREFEAAVIESEKTRLEHMQPLYLQLDALQKEASVLEETLMEKKNAFEEDKLTYELKMADERSKNEKLRVQIANDKNKSFDLNRSSLISDDDTPNFKEKMNVISTRENIFKRRRHSDKGKK